MSGTDGLAEFLTDCYDEAEEMAQDLARSYPGPWSADHSWVCDAAGNTVVHDEYHWSALPYIAANEPKHRLADIKLKRAILAEHAHDDAVHGNGIGCKICHDHGDGIIGAGWCATVRQLGTEFDQHPEYQAGWAP